ncbi:MAG: glycosyltransferase family 4 protein [Chloroflexi bacterium]|nr:glycosyltransferase family 4 protein [Chloroflexota bacterium]
MPTAAAMLPRVLVVARWYPSHDQPGRGSFVADLVATLVARGASVMVASFEATHVRGVAETRPDRGTRAAAAIGTAIDGPAARGGLNRPHSWGVAGVPVARLPVFLDGDRRRPDDVAAAHAAALIPFGLALARAWPFDVIHAHTGLVDGTAALRLAQAVGRPLLVTEHSSTAAGELGDPEAAALYRLLLGEAAAIGSTLGVSPDTIDVLPNAIPIEGFPLGSDRDRDPDALLFVGSRKASKGIERLLRAVAMARAERPQLRLRLIGPPGTGEEEAAWGALIAELGLTGAVRVEPAAQRVEVAAAMRRAGLFVHPSPRETFGMVVAEALASGLPVVTTPSGGGDEIVGADGRYGEVADGLEPEALAAAILRTHGRSRRPEDALPRRAYVEARYAAPAVGERTVGIYEELIAAAGVAGGAPPGDHGETGPAIA